MAYQLGAFSETALIEICPIGGTAVQFASMIETIDIDLGEKDMDQIATLSGGRLVKKTPQAETSITFEGYPIGIGTSTDEGISQLFHVTSGAYSTTEPLTVYNSRSRDLFRVSILWSTGTEATASAASTAGAQAYRFVAAHAFMNSMKPSYTDKVLKFTFIFKVPSFNKQGISMMREESTTGTTALTTLSTYNTTNYGYDVTTNFTW